MYFTKTKTVNAGEIVKLLHRLPPAPLVGFEPTTYRLAPGIRKATLHLTLVSRYFTRATFPVKFNDRRKSVALIR